MSNFGVEPPMTPLLVPNASSVERGAFSLAALVDGEDFSSVCFPESILPSTAD
jgi:hypothetical protein